MKVSKLYVFFIVFALALSVTSPADASGTVTVKPSAMNGWGFLLETGASGAGNFVVGPGIAPLGDGSVHFTTGSASDGIFVGVAGYGGTKLSDITTLQYSTYQTLTSTSTVQTTSLQFNIDNDVTDGEVGYKGRLVFEPYFSETVVKGFWQTWDTLTQGKWWATPSSPLSANCPHATPCTWDDVLNYYPAAGIHSVYGAVLFKAGSGWVAGFDGNVDAFTIGISGDDTTYDFEPETPCTTVCYADAVNGNDTFGGGTPANAKKTIQAALDAVSPNGTVRVLPGNYNESATNRWVLGTNGPHQFGLFLDKDGVTIQGVDAGDNALTDYNALQAYVTTNATNNFGYSGIFVQADDVTIAGLHIGPNTPGDNKTIEIIGDGFTLKDSHVDVPGGGSVYFNDWQFNTDTSHVQAYTLDHNLIDQSTSVDLTSGAGYTGPVSGRQIINNEFENAEFWPSISFNGSGTGVPWFVQSVGGAVIEGNTFTNTFNGNNPTAGHIRVRGDVDDSEFDWTAYWNDNTFNKAVVTLVGAYPPFDVREYNYTSGSYSFNVRRIGVNIQGSIDKAVAGDTVLVAPGTYPEAVQINKNNLIVRGSGADITTIIGPRPSVVAGFDTVTFSSTGATLKGFTITRDGNAVATWNDTRNQGISINGSGNTVEENIIVHNRTGVLLAVSGNTVRNNVINDNRTGIHIINVSGGHSIHNNYIANNWTMGILFRQDTSVDGTQIYQNNITGNWYAQVEDRGNPGGILRNLENNWFGPTPFTTLQQNTAGEPGYAAQIPVAFGGASVPPVTAPTFVLNTQNPNPNGDTGGKGHPDITRLDYTPWLCAGIDTSADIGYQPMIPNDCGGPVTSGVGVSPFPVYLNALTTINAIADDTATGNSNIASAEYQLNGGSWLPMSATDGTFDEPNEAVNATFTVSTLGSNQVCVRATDIWGNLGASSCYTFTVGYVFTGFFQPIDMTAVNIAKAGQTIPVKWRLTDANGVPISDPASFVGVYSYDVSCTDLTGTPPDDIESYSGSSGLQYLGDGYWQFNWKTPKTYAGNCRTMYVKFQGGFTSLEVDFKFKP